MKHDVSLQCSCGKMTGIAKAISPEGGNHLICLCDDCQAYAHFLNRAQDILDANGGTEIFQMAPSQIQITTGANLLRAMRLSKKGLVRWYAGCCRTPVANTMSSGKVPFAGVPVLFLASENRIEALGPILARCMGKFGIGRLPPGTYQRGPIGLLFRAIRLMAQAWIQGKAQPSPFFSPEGKPRAVAQILSPEERNRLRPLCGPK